MVGLSALHIGSHSRNYRDRVDICPKMCCIPGAPNVLCCAHLAIFLDEASRQVSSSTLKNSYIFTQILLAPALDVAWAMGEEAHAVHLTGQVLALRVTPLHPLPRGGHMASPHIPSTFGYLKALVHGIRTPASVIDACSPIFCEKCHAYDLNIPARSRSRTCDHLICSLTQITGN